MIDTINALWICNISRKLTSGALTETETFYSDNRSVRDAIAKLADKLGFAHLVGTWNGKQGVRIFPNSVSESNRFLQGTIG